jgi:hypothetical protein
MISVYNKVKKALRQSYFMGISDDVIYGSSKELRLKVSVEEYTNEASEYEIAMDLARQSFNKEDTLFFELVDKTASSYGAMRSGVNTLVHANNRLLQVTKDQPAVKFVLPPGRLIEMLRSGMVQDLDTVPTIQETRNSGVVARLVLNKEDDFNTELYSSVYRGVMPQVLNDTIYGFTKNVCTARRTCFRYHHDISTNLLNISYTLIVNYVPNRVVRVYF